MTAVLERAEARAAEAWPDAIFDILKRADVRQVAYVPDGGHARLIRAVQAEPSMKAIALTTEEEGLALLTGASLGGERGVLLMQSSGVGNCINMLSVAVAHRTPLPMIVTMRGEFGEFNPWQVPMGSTTQAALELMDLQVLRAASAEEVPEVVQAGANMAFAGGTATAVLLSQRLIGAKVFSR